MFLKFLQWMFPFSPGSLCNWVRKLPRNEEKIGRFLGGQNLSRQFFGPDWEKNCLEAIFDSRHLQGPPENAKVGGKKAGGGGTFAGSLSHFSY